MNIHENKVQDTFNAVGMAIKPQSTSAAPSGGAAINNMTAGKASLGGGNSTTGVGTTTVGVFATSPPVQQIPPPLPHAAPPLQSPPPPLQTQPPPPPIVPIIPILTDPLLQNPLTPSGTTTTTTTTTSPTASGSPSGDSGGGGGSGDASPQPTNTDGTPTTTASDYTPVFMAAAAGWAAGKFLLKKGDNYTAGISVLAGALGYYYATQMAPQMDNSTGSPTFDFTSVGIGAAIGGIAGFLGDKHFGGGHSLLIIGVIAGAGVGYYRWLNTPVVNTATTTTTTQPTS